MANMLTFALILKREAPAVNAALEQALSRLPSSVRDVAAHALMSGGKRLRPLLTLTSARLFGCHGQEVYALAATLEMIHVASLMHDDILDGADMRRGKQATHIKYGISPCLLAGDALMAEASRVVASYGNTAMVECISDAIVRTVAGEAQEIALKGSLTHSIQDYLDVIEGKTGWLLRAAGRLGALYAGAEPDEVRAISDFGLEVGMAFQMVDDALDFASSAATGKPTGGDLREGKLTPPILFYLESLPAAEKTAFALSFAQGGFTDEGVAAVSRCIREQGLDARTRALADAHLHRAEESLALLPDRPERETFRKVLAYVRDRGA